MNSIVNNTLNYRVFGNGHPVVLLHGFLESMSMWDCLSFAPNTQQIRIDLPGHGASILEDENLSMVTIAMQVRKLLIELNISSYTLVGHSMGGYVGLELMKQDCKCEKLILFHSNFWEDSQDKKKDRERVAKIVKKNKTLFIYEAIPNLFMNPEKNDKVVKNLIQEAIKMNSKAIAINSMAMSKRIDNSNFVENNAHKIIVIQGENDTIVPSKKMEKFLVQTKVELIKINNCGHMGHIEKPEEISKILNLFISN